MNDNDPLTFVRLAALTANVTRFLFEKQNQPKHEPRNEHAKTGNGDKANPDQRSGDVARPLRK